MDSDIIKFLFSPNSIPTQKKFLSIMLLYSIIIFIKVLFKPFGIGIKAKSINTPVNINEIVMNMTEKWNSDYEVSLRFDASTKAWLAEDSQGAHAMGASFGETWLNLITAREADGYDLSLSQKNTEAKP